MTVVPLPDTPLNFADAIGVAFALSDCYVFTQAALLLDSDLRCFDLAVFPDTGDRPWRSRLDTGAAIGDLVGAAYASAARSMVAITVGVVDGEVLYESDLAHYRATSVLARLCGLQLLDWIVTDGDLLRSYAEITGRGWAPSLQ